jgi:hypothetical protein
MTTPEALRDAVGRDLKPARPLLPPAARALMLAPLALATVVAVPSVYFLRPDIAELGALRAWGLSLVEAVGGLVVVSLALRESIPGRALSRGAIAAALAGGLALPIAIYLLTAERFDVGVPPRARFIVGMICFRTSIGAAVPGLVAAALLVARAFPLRPGISGALYGLGCGIVADAGLRLYCEFTMPSHVFAAHGGAIVTAMIAGAVVAPLVATAQRR